MPRLVAFVQTDCPTCRLIIPYLNALSKDSVPVRGISQDGEAETSEFRRQMKVGFPLELDRGLELSKRFELVTVPTLFVVDEQDRVTRVEAGFDKKSLNEIAAMFGHAPVASPYDGNPASKPGCT